jgi:hypothetical protein
MDLTIWVLDFLSLGFGSPLPLTIKMESGTVLAFLPKKLGLLCAYPIHLIRPAWHGRWLINFELTDFGNLWLNRKLGRTWPSRICLCFLIFVGYLAFLELTRPFWFLAPLMPLPFISKTSKPSCLATICLGLQRYSGLYSGGKTKKCGIRFEWASSSFVWLYWIRCLLNSLLCALTGSVPACAFLEACQRTGFCMYWVIRRTGSCCVLNKLKFC